MELSVGDKAPNFTLHSSNGVVSLNQFGTKNIVLYFYPQDDTPTCTQQACDFRDNLERITSLGAVVLGVSPDNEKSHQKFISKFNLNYLLLSDDEHKVADLYGVWDEKTMFGRTYMGIVRTTFIIDESGVITHIFPKVRLKGHIDNIVNALTKLSNKDT